ncbi:hypothetical protein MARLIPOL_03415 [Marinobacter lipolyticus SM19]|uniref:DUF2894 domain-containing protein n=1 Tax=Marinobacter lipolyticus SM19 TaxID=1318628 RepID=R8B3D1_9GAMM|nr:DUF2894 domain-containing protein [Marinobacter lipolyticus]EON93049.1 hypothetical protein MARLIPOL_03415 [Marinobacter lipolyticus SM19]
MSAAAEATTMEQQLAELKHSGADRLDSVRFRYLEALEQRLRAKGLQGTRHWQKLEKAVAEFQARSGQQAGAEQPEQPAQTGHPSPLQLLLDTLNQAPDTQVLTSPSPVEKLIFGEQDGPAPTAVTNGSPRPLKAMARVQADQGTQALQDRIRQAIEQTPENAGPMNAHRLVSRAIATMEKLSPEYLNRFVNYADTLLALERLGRKG